MSMRLASRRTDLVLPILFLFLAALFAVLAKGAELERSVVPAGETRPADACVATTDGGLDAGARAQAPALPILGEARVRLVFIRGVVEPLERDFFGRPRQIALVSVSDDGVLVQNAVEDVAAGTDLKDHVGDNVTVRGAILVKADGRATILVDAFEVNRSRAEAEAE